MATTIFSAAGQAIGGPAGQAIGAFAGGALDRAIEGSPNPAALQVQSAAYGQSAPRLYGTLRVSGAVLWATGLREEGAIAQKLSGGGSRTYSTSVAIGLSARPIRSVGRIWADGRLIRDVSGAMSIAGAVRVYTGSETQQADPLIVAAEGLGGAPAYRGIAYVVFENLQLGEFGNRVPTLAFEVTADDAPPAVGAIAGDLFDAAGASAPDGGVLNSTVAGYGVGGAATLAGALGQLGLFEPHDAVSDGTRLRLVKSNDAAAITVGADEAGAYAGSPRAGSHIWRVDPAQRQAGRIEASYFDPSRDYQPGWQSVTPSSGGGRLVRRYDLPVALAAGDARALTERLARETDAARATRTIELPYGRADLEVSDTIALGGDARVWQITRQALAAMVVSLNLEAVTGGPDATAASDPGRVPANRLDRQGETRIDILDLPDWSREGGSAPVVWLAVSAAGAWRAAEIISSTDAGASWRSLGVARIRATTGNALGILQAGPCDRWDEQSWVDIFLTDTDGWLTSATADAVLGGANLAMVGNELIHYRSSEASGGGRFRLSGLLRGRFGTEFAASAHEAGEPFVLLDRNTLFRAEAGQLPLGAAVAIKAVGPTELAATAEEKSLQFVGNSLRPFAPKQLRIARDPDGTLRVSWIRSSRTGLGWPDGADAPLGEEREQYLVTLVPAGGGPRTYTTTSESLTISVVDQIAQTGETIVAGEISVTQVSATFGPGSAVSAIF